MSTPDDPRFSYDISVLPPKATALQAKVGDKVVVELGRWESRHTNPEGRIVEVLGAPSADGIDMLGVLRQYGLNREFPEHVVRERHVVSDIPSTAADLKGRRDCRKQLVVTIDPDDARDFDDAICLEKAGANRWKLWVHIADVSHYVRPGSALDEEARRRGNSSYLVDRVIPMLARGAEQRTLLPEAPCRPAHEVRRVSHLAADGRVLSTDFYPAVIHSKKRLTYADALAVLERAPGDEIGQMLHQAHALAQAIRKRRFENGSLDLDFPETKDPPRCDRQGPSHRTTRQRHLAPAHRRVHAPRERGRRGTAHEAEACRDLPHPRGSRS
jgi:ribonuclease R